MADQAWLEGLARGFVECRALRHSWEIKEYRLATEEEVDAIPSLLHIAGAAAFRRDYRQFIARNVVCQRCQTVRVEMFGRKNPNKLGQFDHLFRHYYYPKGYRYRGEEDRPRQPDFNLELLNRFLNQ